MGGNVCSLSVLELRSTLSFLPDLLQRRGLEDNKMAPGSKFRFMFNSGVWWGSRMKGFNTRMKVNIKLRKGEHRDK